MNGKIVAVVGSYRRDGVVETLVKEVLSAAGTAGAEAEIIRLSEIKIEFCTNCRQCAQKSGGEAGVCPLPDEMAALLETIRKADALVLGAPVNFFNVTAIFRRFMERLICLAYWPWGQHGPQMRWKNGRKPAVLITASAMPAFLGPVFTGAVRALKATAATLGARPVAVVFAGMAGTPPDGPPTAAALRKACAAGQALARQMGVES